MLRFRANAVLSGSPLCIAAVLLLAVPELKHCNAWRQLNYSERAFLQSLALANQSRRDLFTLYEGWLARIEALNAARLNNAFVASDDPASIARRREALEAHSRLTREITSLRTNANREKQLNRRVDLNLEIQRLEADLATHKKNL